MKSSEKRAAGRTTRMLKTAVEATAAGKTVAVFAVSVASANMMRNLFIRMGGVAELAKFIPYGEKNLRVAGSRDMLRLFDHDIVDRQMEAQ